MVNKCPLPRSRHDMTNKLSLAPNFFKSQSKYSMILHVDVGPATGGRTYQSCLLPATCRAARRPPFNQPSNGH